MKTEPKDYCEVGCLNLLGAIIRQALMDYSKVKNNVGQLNKKIEQLRKQQKQISPKTPKNLKERNKISGSISGIGLMLQDFEGAETFLFSKNGMERYPFITEYLDVDFIRRVAKKGGFRGRSIEQTYNVFN